MSEPRLTYGVCVESVLVTRNMALDWKDSLDDRTRAMGEGAFVYLDGGTSSTPPREEALYSDSDDEWKTAVALASRLKKADPDELVTIVLWTTDE
jgi:hypothetical protein